MKRRVAIIAGCWALAGVAGGCASRTEPAFQVRTPPAPTEKFDIAALTPEQRRLAEAFRQKAGAFRKPEFDALFKAGVLPYTAKRIERADVIALLGPPSGEHSGYIGYNLGFEGGKGHSCSLEFFEGRLTALVFGLTL